MLFNELMEIDVRVERRQQTESCFKKLGLKNLGWRERTGRRMESIGGDTKEDVNVVCLWIISSQ